MNEIEQRTAEILASYAEMEQHRVKMEAAAVRTRLLVLETNHRIPERLALNVAALLDTQFYHLAQSMLFGTHHDDE